MSRVPFTSVMVVASALGCGGTHTGPSATLTASGPLPATTPTAVSRLPVVPMRIVPVGAGLADAPVLSLAADGTLSVGGQPFGRLDHARVIDTHGTELLRVDDNGRIVTGSTERGRMTDAGDVSYPRGVVHVGDDGVPVIIHHVSGRQDPGPMRVEGFVPAARSTATVLVILVRLLSQTLADAGV